MGTNIVDLIIGIIFGSCLVLAGLSDPDRIIGALRLKDTHIIRTVILFLLVALVGTWIVEKLGTVEIDNNTAAIITLLSGGLLVGAGLGLTGYSPSTSFAGAASGRVDAIIAILGMFFGAYIFIFIYPPVIQPLEKIFNYGKVTLPQIVNVSAGALVMPIFAAGSLFLLLLTHSIKKRQTKETEGSQSNAVNERFSDEHNIKHVPKENILIQKRDFLATTRLLVSWKNSLFIIMIICLLLIQVSFWLVSMGHIGSDSLIMEHDSSLSSNITVAYISTAINISNTILVFASFLYVLILFFCLSVSLGASSGGLKFISSAFFSALIALVLLFPWQILFESALLGAVFTPYELIRSNSVDVSSLFFAILLYLRFIGFWAFTILLLIRSQIYSKRWAKSINSKAELCV